MRKLGDYTNWKVVDKCYCNGVLVAEGTDNFPGQLLFNSLPMEGYLHIVGYGHFFFKSEPKPVASPSPTCPKIVYNLEYRTVYKLETDLEILQTRVKYDTEKQTMRLDGLWSGLV